MMKNGQKKLEMKRDEFLKVVKDAKDGESLEFVGKSLKEDLFKLTKINI